MRKKNNFLYEVREFDRMLRNLTGNVVVLPTAADSPGLAGVMPDPFLQPFRGEAAAEGGRGKGSAALSSPTE